MDHPIEELDECIFDHLSSRPDEPQSVTSIYNNITGNSGHRCSELNSAKFRETYRRRFIANCYSLDSNFRNIHKVFRNRKLYLVYSERPHWEVVEKFGDSFPIDEIDLDSEILDMNVGDVVEFMINEEFNLKNLDLKTKFDGDDNIVHILVKYGKTKSLQKLLDSFEVDLEVQNSRGKTPLDIALEEDDAQAVKVILGAIYEENIFELNQSNRRLKSRNTELMDNYKRLESEVADLRRSNFTKNIWLTAVLTVVIGYFLL